MNRLASCIALVSFAILGPGLAQAGDDPHSIMESVEARDTGRNGSSTMVMTIVDGEGRKRTRTIRSSFLDDGTVTRRLMLLHSPANMRNTGFLTFDYDDSGKDDDQWLYLPSLRKSTRIAGVDKSGSFLGSDLSYSDLSKHHASQYAYTMLDPSVRVGDDECWLIEARPKTAKTRDETGYVKVHVWVSKSKRMRLQVKAWTAKGKKIKLLKFDEIQRVGNVWVPHKIAARTMERGEVASTTVIAVTDVSIDEGGVNAEDFTTRRLEKGL